MLVFSLGDVRTDSRTRLVEENVEINVGELFQDIFLFPVYLKSFLGAQLAGMNVPPQLEFFNLNRQLLADCKRVNPNIIKCDMMIHPEHINRVQCLNQQSKPGLIGHSQYIFPEIFL